MTDKDPGNLPEVDVLASFRKRTWSLFAIICSVFFLPGSIFIFLHGFRALAVGVGLMLVILWVNRSRINHDLPPAVKTPGFLAVLMFVIGLSIFQRGEFGVFWAFPAILFISFVEAGRVARVYTAVFIAGIAAVTFYCLDIPLAARSVVALMVTAIFTNIFLRMIEQLQSSLVSQSITDPLTGALNRRQMETVLQDAVERKRRSSTPASLLVFDVDRFKSVNDTYGHAAGDRVLTEMARLVADRSRVMDRLFRTGGEEFMLFLPDTHGSGASILAEELRVLVSRAVLLENRAITISIGITELAFDETVDDWIRRGDDALYMAKKGGRNQAVEAAGITHFPAPPSVAPDARTM